MEKEGILRKFGRLSEIGGRLVLVMSFLSILTAPRPTYAQPAIAAAYSSAYTLDILGTVPGLPPQYGGLTLKLNDPNTLIIGGNANEDVGKLYSIGITRDAQNHITGFTGSATIFADGAYNDGGVAYGPGGVLFLARWPRSELGQTKPGSIITDKIINLATFGIANGGPGGLNFVPAGFPGAGQFKLVEFNTGNWYTLTLAPDGSGTFNITSATLNTTITGGPEGFVYVPPGSPLFTSSSMLVSEYSAGMVAAYSIDANGNPLAGSRADFITGLTGAEGAFIDPLTGDFLFSTFGGEDRVVAVRGFAAPSPGLVISPTSKDFGIVNVGSIASQVFTLSNNGTADVVVTSIQLTGGDAAMFSLALSGSNTCPNLTPTLAPAASCTFTARFAPTSEGAKTTTLRVTSNNPSGPVDARLDGMGTLEPVFADSPETQWAEDYINALYYAGITTGCSMTPPLLYCPDDPVTREQMAAFIIRALEGEPAANYCGVTPPFTDVPVSNIYCKYIKRLLELGITIGCGDGTTYCPSGNVTREQMAAFIVRSAEGEPASGYCGGVPPFNDVSAEVWSCRYIKRLSELNITKGCEIGYYCPSSQVIRDMMAAFLARAFLGMP
jgi:rubredoxin